MNDMLMQFNRVKTSIRHYAGKMQGLCHDVCANETLIWMFSSLYVIENHDKKLMNHHGDKF